MKIGRIQILIAEDELRHDRNRYPLSELRRYLTIHHQDLVKKHFIKAITVQGKTELTFDWHNIYSIARHNFILEDFLNTR